MAAETTPALRLLGVRVSVQRKGRSGKSTLDPGEAAAGSPVARRAGV